MRQVFVQGVEPADNLEGAREAPGNPVAAGDAEGEDSFAGRMRAQAQMQRSRHGQPVPREASLSACCIPCRIGWSCLLDLMGTGNRRTCFEVVMYSVQLS